MHKTEGCAKDEFCRNREFSIATDFLLCFFTTYFSRLSIVIENSHLRQRIPEHGISYVATVHGRGVKPRKNSIFLKKGKTVISVENQNFSRSWMMKRTSSLNCLSKASYPVEFHRIPRQSKFHVF